MPGLHINEHGIRMPGFRIDEDSIHMPGLHIGPDSVYVGSQRRNSNPSAPTPQESHGTSTRLRDRIVQRL